MSYTSNPNQDTSIPNMVNNSLNSCPSPVQESDSVSSLMNTLLSTYSNNYVNVLNAMNIPTCSTYSGPGGPASCVTQTGVFGDTNQSCSEANITTSIGCEAITLQAALSAQLTENLNCTLSTLQLSSESYLSQQNYFNLTLGNGAVFNNGLNVNVTQVNNSSANVINFANSSVQSALQYTAELSANTVASSFSNITVVGNATSQDQEALQESINSLTSLISDNTIGQIVLNSLNNVLQMNNANETIGAVVVYGNADIIAAQTNLNEYVINNIANSIVSAVNDSNVQTAIQTDLQNYQTQSLIGATGGGNSKHKFGLTQSDIIFIVIGCIVGFGLLCLGVYIYYRYVYVEQKEYSVISDVVNSTLSHEISNSIQSNKTAASTQSATSQQPAKQQPTTKSQSATSQQPKKAT